MNKILSLAVLVATLPSWAATVTSPALTKFATDSKQGTSCPSSLSTDFLNLLKSNRGQLTGAGIDIKSNTQNFPSTTATLSGSGRKGDQMGCSYNRRAFALLIQPLKTDSRYDFLNNYGGANDPFNTYKGGRG